MTDYIIEHIDDREYSFTVADAPERSTGWRDCHCVDLETGLVVYFDAELNKRFPVSPIRDLDIAISRFEDAIADEDRDEWDPSDDCPVPLTFSNTGCHR